MAKSRRTELSELLVLLRRIVVLSVAAYGLFREVPYVDLAIRLGVLWAAAYLSGLLIELAVKHLRHRAFVEISPTASAATEERRG